MMSKKVVLGLSGGVDSAVSCYLLLKQGYTVIPVFMKNWDTVANNDILGHKKNQPDGCESNNDYLSAIAIAKHFNLKLHRVDFVNEYWNYVFKFFIDQYKKSITPNPDILCNKFIKFGFFKDYAWKYFKIKNIATGHYAKIKKTTDGYFLVKSKDQTKDQTYFLCDLNQQQIKNCIFPLGNYLKSEVRKIAKKIKLPNWDRKDSTGICFIGKRNFNDFLKNYVPMLPGKIVDISNNKIVGEHIGTMFYTIGQNKDLHLSGCKEKYYVCDKNVKKKIIYVCPNKLKEKYLLSNYCELDGFNFINKNINLPVKNLYVRFRHLQKLIKVKAFFKNKNKYILQYTPTMSVAKGQFAVIYNKNICIGGAPVLGGIKLCH